MLREIEISSLDSTPIPEGETREGENPPNMRSGKEVTFTGGPGKRSSAGDLAVALARALAAPALSFILLVAGSSTATTAGIGLVLVAFSIMVSL